MNKVIIERHLKDESMRPQLMKLIGDLRSAAMHQPGYVTGESLISADDGCDITVLSTWMNAAYWKAWETAEQRIIISELMEPLLEGDAKCRVYDFTNPEEIL